MSAIDETLAQEAIPAAELKGATAGTRRGSAPRLTAETVKMRIALLEMATVEGDYEDRRSAISGTSTSTFCA